MDLPAGRNRASGDLRRREGNCVLRFLLRIWRFIRSKGGTALEGGGGTLRGEISISRIGMLLPVGEDFSFTCPRADWGLPKHKRIFF